MRLICPNCAAQYEIDAAVLPEKGRDVECSRCGQIWFQPRPPAEDNAHFDPEARPALNRSLSDSVLSVLREEAARELRAREEDIARARMEKARFEAESFSRTPIPPAVAKAEAAAHESALPEFPFVDDRANATSDTSAAPEVEVAQIDWPATTITDERIQESPLPPEAELSEDEWVVAQPAAPLDTAEDLPAFATADAGWRDQEPQERQPEVPAEDEPVATILFDDSDSGASLALPGDEDREGVRTPKADAPAKAFVGLPNDLPGDDAPLTTAIPARQAEPKAPRLPVSVDSTPTDATPAPRSGYARGFGLSIGLAATLAGFYLIAPSISGPGALGGFAAEYRSAADQGRVWLGEKLGFSDRSSN